MPEWLFVDDQAAASLEIVLSGAILPAIATFCTRKILRNKRSGLAITIGTLSCAAFWLVYAIMWSIHGTPTSDEDESATYVLIAAIAAIILTPLAYVISRVTVAVCGPKPVETEFLQRDS